MIINNIITTVLGAMMFPFLIIITWDRGGEEVGLFGGIVLVGSSWLVNHGFGLIVQG